MYDYLIVGAGFAGSVMAERLASQLNKKVLVVEKRNHIGGNAYDEYDEHGILVHKYGPHIFHTNSNKIFNYLSQFTEWIPYEHKVLAKLNGELYSIPINRLTINKLYNLDLKSENEIAEFYKNVRENRYPVKNSEDIIVNQVGIDLFEKFFKHYTKKQWKLEPKDLAPTVCGRIPVRINDDCRYFTDKYQFMPKDGYTKMFERMLAHKNIEVALNTDFKKILNDVIFNKMIYTGPIDYFFDYEFGKLPYRSIRFENRNFKVNYIQENAVINHVGDEVEFTRATEYKHVTKQKAESTTISYEFPLLEGDPYYPVPNKENQTKYFLYQEKASKLNTTILCGRLAEYRYYEMNHVISRSLKKISEI